MKTTKLLMAIEIIAAIFSSCSKGDTGATGPQGPAGANGNANVISNTYTITPGDWNTSEAGAEYTCSINDASLTNINQDNVSVYVSENSGENITIPTSNLFTFGDDMAYLTENQKINIVYFNSSAPNISLVFTVIIIPAQ